VQPSAHATLAAGTASAAWIEEWQLEIGLGRERDRLGRTSGYGNDGRKTQFSRKSMSTAESEPRLSRAVIGFGMANSAQRTLSLGRWLAADDPLTTLDQAPPMSDIGRKRTGGYGAAMS
jgi:hypothetical protein